MAIESILQNYTAMTSTQGTKGYNGGVAVDYDGDLLTFKEADGDNYSISASNLSDSDINALSSKLNTDVKVQNTEKTENTKYDPNSNSLEDNKAKLQEFTTRRDDLTKTAETIKKTVESLSEDIKADFEKSFKEQEKITKEEQERIQELVQNQIEQFKNDKENGKNVSLSDLQANITKGLTQGGFDESMSALMSNLVVTNSKMKQMDILLGELGTLNTEIKDLDAQIANLESVIARQEEEAREAAKKSCDPIGFQDENGAKFEFVIDRDGNGALSNFSEFLGAENFFDEMIALDADKSGDVSTDELNKAGVKVLVTEKDGTQSMKSLADAFGGKDVNVDLNSYKEAGKGAKADNGQTLLGNFNINVGDSQYNGYSTLDTAEYLQSNYKFTDENPVTAGSMAGKAAEDELGTNDIDAFIEEYTDKLAEFQTQFDQLTELLGLDKDLINTINELAQVSAESEANAIISKADKEAEKAEKAEEKETEKEEEKDEKEEKIAA